MARKNLAGELPTSAPWLAKRASGISTDPLEELTWMFSATRSNLRHVSAAASWSKNRFSEYGKFTPVFGSTRVLVYNAAGVGGPL